jgi:hypothetical protein
MNPHLEALIRLFVRKEKQERILFLASKPRRRSEMLSALLHDTRSLDLAAATRISARAADIAALAQRLGGESERAYCASDIVDVDDRELGAGEALRLVVGRERDSLVFCRGRASRSTKTTKGSSSSSRGRSAFDF